LTKAAVGAPNDLQKAEIDLTMKEEPEIETIIKEKDGIDNLHGLSASGAPAAVIKGLDMEARSTEARNAECDDLAVKERSSGIKLKVEEDRAGGEAEVRPERGNITSPEPALHEEG